MKFWKELKKLPKSLWIIFFSVLINRTGTMALPFLVIYLTSKEGFGAAESGLVLSAYGAGSLITAPFVGKLSDRIGALKVMKLSLILAGIVLLTYPFFNTYIVILLITFVWSILSEAFRPASLSLISEIVTSSQRRTAFAINRLAINIGMSIGPAAGGLLTLINFSIIFYVDGITSILAGLFLIYFTNGTSIVESKKYFETPIPREEIDIKHHSVLKDRSFIFFLFPVFLVSAIFFQSLGAFPLYIVEDLGYTATVFGALTAVNTVIIIFVEVPLNNLMSNWSLKKSLMLGAFLTGLGFGAMVFSFNLPAIIFTIIIWTFGEMIFFPSTSVYVSEISSSEKRGEYMGFYQMSFSLAFMVGPWLGNKVYENFGAFYLWIGILFLGLVSALMFSFVKEKKIL